MRIEQGVDFEFRGQQEWGVARPSAGKRIANLGESNVRLEICLRYVHPHNTREAVACTNNARDHKAVSVGMSVESEWKVGSKWRMYADGSLIDSGEILESVSQKRLVMSWLNEWKPEFKAEGNSRCVYEIEPTGASAKLTLTHSIERPDSKFIGAVSDGWPMVISNLKSLLETGDVALVYHRGRGD